MSFRVILYLWYGNSKTSIAILNMTNIQKQLFMTSNAPKLQLKVNNHLWEDIPEWSESHYCLISHYTKVLTLFIKHFSSNSVFFSVYSSSTSFCKKMNCILYVNKQLNKRIKNLGVVSACCHLHYRQIAFCMQTCSLFILLDIATFSLETLTLASTNYRRLFWIFQIFYNQYNIWDVFDMYVCVRPEYQSFL